MRHKEHWFPSCHQVTNCWLANVKYFKVDIHRLNLSTQSEHVIILSSPSVCFAVVCGLS